MSWTITSTQGVPKIYRCTLISGDTKSPGKEWTLIRYEDGHEAWSSRIFNTKPEAEAALKKTVRYVKGKSLKYQAMNEMMDEEKKACN